MPDGNYILDKNAFFKSLLCKRKNRREEDDWGVQPDIIHLLKKDNILNFTLIELKLGYNFDTKKSKGEVDHLKKEMVYLKNIFDASNINCTCDYKICSWYVKDKNLVYSETKHKFDINKIITPNELCFMLRISYDDINNKLDSVKQVNVDSLLNKLLSDELTATLIINKIAYNENIRKIMKSVIK